MKMKKTLNVFVTISMLLLTSCSKKSIRTITDGTYTGTGEGYGGLITTKVTFENGEITKIEVVDHNETQTWSDAAILNIPSYITSAQSVNVDTVTGATKTSHGIQESVVDAIKKANGNEEEWNEDKTNQHDTTHISRKADVVIVGGGISGMTSALRLQQLGIDCILVEKSDTLGGSMKYGGHYSQIYTDDSDESESVENIFNDIITDEDKEDATAEILKDNLEETIAWQISDLGISFETEYLNSTSFTEDAVKEYDSSNSNVGELLGKEVEVSGAEVLLKTCVMSFEEADNEIIGIQAIDTEGNIYHIVADHIIIASGSGSIEGMVYAASESNTSDAYYILEEEGYQVSESDSYSTSKVVLKLTEKIGVDSYDAIQACAKEGMILVDSEGKRFVNEESSREDLNDAIHDKEVYLVMNESAYSKWATSIAEQLSDVQKDIFEESDSISYATTLEEVCRENELEYDALLNTIIQYDTEVENEETDIFGRIHTNEIIVPEEDVYIVKLTEGILENGQVILTDENLNILEASGKSIKNVYVVGSACSNVLNGKNIEGGANAWAFVSGKYIADKIAEKYE